MKHGNRAGGKKTPEYSSWSHAKDRTTCPTNQDYAEYALRGITMCDRWLNSFAAFLEDMGARLVGTTLERIDNNKGYCPENCKWATNKDQQNNRRKYRRRNELARTVRKVDAQSFPGGLREGICTEATTGGHEGAPSVSA